ncbi:MAG: pseudaminic acid synthase [Methylobacteriaceae bacterium]|nr:pseudaminic acid synthase [Methylobacteriaceae bacterium]
MTSFKIGDREISRQAPPYIVAEMSGNHNHDIGRARALIDAAAKAGADAVKLQTYRADTITIRSDRPEFRIPGGLWKDRTLYELYEEAYTPWEWHGDLFAHARAKGIDIFSSPFDLTAVDFLAALDAPAYKIASPEAIDWGLMEKVAATGKPVILSTGMASNAEIGEAIEVLKSNGAGGIVVLHCISSYPAPTDQAHLAKIRRIAERFDVLTGLSDHTMGLEVPIAAVALGAVLIEKHFTLKRADGGVDSAFSLEAEELAELVRATRLAHQALGDPEADDIEAERMNRQFRRSIYFVADLPAGAEIRPEHVKSIRPGLGLPPKHLRDIVGRRTKAPIAYGTPTSWELIA